MRALLFVVFAGCISAPVPMTFERHGLEKPARCLVVFLPGRGDRASTFTERGFIEAFEQSGASVDLVATDATLGYYVTGTISERLETDVIAPARARGAEQLWLVGNSMGGLGLFSYARRHPVDGVFALAPFLGPTALSDEVRAAGGLGAWNATDGDDYRQLWSSLQREVKEGRPTIYLGYGEQDRLASQDSVLGAALPEGHVFHVAGGHDWVTWRKLLQQFLERSDFKTRCAP
jgi:pimeloyl-ACP methyl ester carboxylesterase